MPDIYTAAGVRLNCVEERSVQVDSDPDPRTCKYVHFDLSEEQLGQTWRYNCWGFTFLPRRYWINCATDVDNILQDNCDPVPDGSVRVGDVIRYRRWDDILNSYKTTHTGRVWETDGVGHATLIRSKWGAMAEYIHPLLGGSPEPVPSSYGTHLAYFRQRAPLSGIADIWIKDSPEDDGEQHPDSPWWSSPDIFIDRSPFDGIPDINPVFGQLNRVWARVRNRGDLTANGIHVRYYWVNPTEGLAPDKWHLIPGTPGHPNPAGPIDVPANSSIDAPFVEWNPGTSQAQLCIIAVAYYNDNPRDRNNPDPIVYPFEVHWDNNCALNEASMLMQPLTQSLNFNDIPEGDTTVRAIVFSIQSCRAVTLQITAGPTVTSGPPATSFDTPLGVTTTLDTTPLFPTEVREARIWVSFTGTSAVDTATGTVTVRCLETEEEWTIPITANTVTPPSVAVVMALDISNSMNFDSGLAPELPKRKDVLKFSAPPLVEVIQERHAIGVVTFDHDAYPGAPVTPVGPPVIGEGRHKARQEIDAYTPNPEGWTSIGDGLERGHLELEPITGYDNKATIILTDGHENREKYVADVTDIINERVYAIGLGTPEVIQPATLTALTNGTGGYMLVTGELGDDYFRLAKYYLQILAGVTNQEIILDPDGWLLPGQTHRIPFQLSETDITADVILLSPSPDIFNFHLETPDGTIIDQDTSSASPVTLYALGRNVSYYRISLPVPSEGGEAREGTWRAVLNISGKDKRLQMSSAQPIHSNPSSAVQMPVHGLRYNLSVQTYSNMKMRVFQFQDSYEIGGTITIRAVLTQYGLPVSGRSIIRAVVTYPDDTQTALYMPEVGPGVFETKVITSMAGVYRFHVRGHGSTLQGTPFTREQIRTGFVYRGGDSAPRSARDDPTGWLRRICRLRCFRLIILLLIILCIIGALNVIVILS